MFLDSREAGVDPFDDGCCLFHDSGSSRCENVSCAPSAVSVRTRERRDTCPEPSGLNPYRRLSRTLVPRWVDLHCVLLHRDVASSSSPDQRVLDASASPMSFTASSSLTLLLHCFSFSLLSNPVCPSLSPRALSHTSPLTLPRFLKALSFASLDKEELLSPINQSTLHRCSSVRSMVSSATYGSNNDYIGLALPMDINDIFHIRDSAYFQQRISPPSEERKRFLFGDGDGEFTERRAEKLQRAAVTAGWLFLCVCRRPPGSSAAEAAVQHL